MFLFAAARAITGSTTQGFEKHSRPEPASQDRVRSEESGTPGRHTATSVQNKSKFGFGFSEYLVAFANKKRVKPKRNGARTSLPLTFATKPGKPTQI